MNPWELNQWNMGRLLTVYGKAWEHPQLFSIVPLLEEYPRDPKLDASIGARIPSRMKQEVLRVKESLGLSQADIVRLGVAEAIRRSKITKAKRRKK